MTFYWPQIVYIVLVLLGLGIDFQRHGEPRTGKHNAWISLVANVLFFAVLWYGGFFKQ